MAAIEQFGAPRLGLTVEDLTVPGMVFQIGVPPRRIDIITSIAGVGFDEAWASRLEISVRSLARPMPVLGREALLKNKRAVGRPQDLADVAKLEALGPAPQPKRPRPRRRR
jgi:hypothetical protein